MFIRVVDQLDGIGWALAGACAAALALLRRQPWQKVRGVQRVENGEPAGGEDRDRPGEVRPDKETPLWAPEQEPIYGPTYLPRKFKIALAVPPDNDVDVFAQDLGRVLPDMRPFVGRAFGALLAPVNTDQSTPSKGRGEGACPSVTPGP